MAIGNLTEEAIGNTVIHMHRKLDWLLPSW